MADGGAWQSGVFDNGRDFQSTAKAVPGVPAAMYNPPASGRSGNDGAYMPIVSIVLRCAAILFTTVAFGIIASNKGQNDVDCSYSSDYSDYCIVTWEALKSSNLAYLLAINVIVCFYSIVQLVLSCVSACSGRSVLKGPKSPAATITFSMDQALTYLLAIGCGAGAAAAAFFSKGEGGSLSCSDGFRVFCDKNSASVAMSFIAFLCIALSTLLAYFRLYRTA